MVCGSEIVTSQSNFKYSSFVFIVLHTFVLFYLRHGFIYKYIYFIYINICTCSGGFGFPFSVILFSSNRSEKVTCVIQRTYS